MSTPGEHVRETAVAPGRPAVATVADPATEVSSNESAVSWSAIFAGAAAAAALSLALVLLGVGFGLSTVSPWAFEGVSAETFGWGVIVWICLTSIIASGMGGYLTGRLRIKWVSVHGDETYFRDTAHGFLSWAVALLFQAAVLTTAVGGMLGTGLQAGAQATAGTGMPGQALVQGDQRPGAAGQGMQQQGTQPGQRPHARMDQRPQTGVGAMGPQTAQDVEEARRLTARTALWLFISMLMGAFAASLMATFGGRQRDDL
ncbi:hypothetical protein [Alkalisalibacterium limincola]|uniref:hypothetical protein n=1 Tax=Alkalisalibacterium limincola TaxID=2699169 RepID=UPI0016505429|nr:hypothetical protein [Alkalisalibacterium limincola]